MAENKQPILQKITLENLLSFGPDPVTLELRNLNVLIGPNGSGKSNLIEAISLLRSLPVSDGDADQGIWGVLRAGGGPGEWLWKGHEKQLCGIEVSITRPFGGHGVLRHSVSLRLHASSSRFVEEVIESDQGISPFRFAAHSEGLGPGNRLELHARASVLAQLGLTNLRDPDLQMDLYALSGAYEKLSIYREWQFGRNSTFRQPQRADVRNDRLREDFSNLHMVLSRLQKNPLIKRSIIEGLRDLYEDIADFVVVAEGGTVQFFLTEGDYSIPATRLSDGTLRYLCLLTILCDPEPPPLICIEEPELGLHPDILPKLAKLLIDASSRTQLIVTTHSDILVDAMTEQPESIVVCEKQDGKTSMRRLDRNDLSEWLQKYRLGELWSRGMIGGNRW